MGNQWECTFSLEMGIELWVDSNIWGSFNLSLVTEDTQRIDADLRFVVLTMSW